MTETPPVEEPGASAADAVRWAAVTMVLGALVAGAGWAVDSELLRDGGIVTVLMAVALCIRDGWRRRG